MLTFRIFLWVNLWVNMARKINKLTPLEIKALSKQGLYSDGNGLYLRINNDGAKSWRYRFMLDGNSREMGMGSLNLVSLSKARQEAIQCKLKVREGIDPIEERKASRAHLIGLNKSIPTFKECAVDYIRAHGVAWKNAKHEQQWVNSLTNHVYPKLGSMAVNAIERSHIMQVLEPIWRIKTETAKRIRGRIEMVLDWATVQGLREGENPARWRGHLDKLLPKPSAIMKEKHFAALPYTEIYDFMESLRSREANSAQLLRLIILTATRSGEARSATWSEIDLDKAIWTIPAERMKGKKEHVIPLCKEAVEIIKALPHMAGSDYLFAGIQSGKPLSDMVFAALMKRMARTGITTHGFRSTFRDWAAEQTAFPREVIEAALAHKLKDKAEAAYFRSNLLDKRRELMNQWAAYTQLPTIESGQVIKIADKSVRNRS